MPTVGVYRDQLFDAIGRRFTEKEFDNLCFDFGIELDDVTSDKEMVVREKGEKAAEGLSEEVVYKIDVPANRYDLLCLEGIARALRIFLCMEPVPQYKVIHPKNKIQMFVKPETSGVRPFVVCAVLRNITFNQQRYDSFLDLQDKLHQNIGRRRTLIAIGTHDLDTLAPPFSYEALPKDKIRFQPLMEEKEFNVEELFHYYNHEKPNCHVKPYLPITEGFPVHPVIYDQKRTVLSLPPIINGEHSKISLNTKNVFIECTGTDKTKLNIVLNIMISMFTHYCAEPFSVESCEVVMPDGAKTNTPSLDDTLFEAKPGYINKGIGINMEANTMASILSRMQLNSTYDKETDTIKVRAPPTRADILHPCDIQEDVAIAYGYNNIKKTIPACHTEGRQQPLNKLSDQVREIVAQAGYLEVMTWILGNYDENFSKLKREDDGNTCVTLANYKTEDFNIVRTSLIPGLLKTMNANFGRVNLPVKIFETSDVVHKDSSADVGARNNRRLGALYCGNTSGFEVIHGVVDQVLHQLGAVFKSDVHEGQTAARVYSIRPSHDPTLFPGRRADVLLNGEKIGIFGILHPDVLSNFEIPCPCSVMELNLEHFL